MNAYLDSKNTAPAESAATVTPSDTADLPGGTCRALYVGTGGNLQVDMNDGTTIVFPNAPVGVLPIRVKRVRNASTTASNIVALY